MKILIAVLDCIRWIASILLVVAIPFAWILRDGLGPDAKESTGFDAIVRTFSSAEVWILAFAFIALSAAVRFLSTHGASEKKAAKWSWRGAAYAFVVAFLLCLLGVIVFREWADRERQRKAEEYSEYMKCMDEALNQVIPSLSFEPPATFGDAIEFFDKCALNCLCKAGHDGMGRIRVVVADDVEMEELLKKPMPTIAVTDIKARDALRLVCEEFGCRFDINPYGRTITIYELIGCELYTTKVIAAEREQTINLPNARYGGLRGERYRCIRRIDGRQVGKQERRNGEKVIARMKAIRLPKISFAPPNTLSDAVKSLAEATRSEASDGGFAFMIKSDDRVLEDGEESVPLESLVVPKIEASDISSYDALRLVCEAVDCKWNIEDGVVVVRPMGAGGYPDDWITRTYTGVDLPARDWTHWVEANGVKLPEGTRILHSPESMQLRVSSTRETVERIEKLLESDVDPNHRDAASNGDQTVK